MPQLWRQTPQSVQRGRRDVQRVGLLPQRLPRHPVEWFRVVVVILFVVVGLGVIHRFELFGCETRVTCERIETSGFIGPRLELTYFGRLDERTELPMLKGFREFILRGNVIDLAVAFVIGAAFTAIVTTVVTSLFNPLIGAIFSSSALSKTLVVTIPAAPGGHPAKLLFGAVIAAVIQFVLVAIVVYFVFVLPMNHFRKRAEARKAKDAVVEEAVPTELELLTDIRNLLAQNQSGGTPPNSSAQ
jgi:large conductance mechanosensitive channel